MLLAQVRVAPRARRSPSNRPLLKLPEKISRIPPKQIDDGNPGASCYFFAQEQPAEQAAEQRCCGKNDQGVGGCSMFERIDKQKAA